MTPEPILIARCVTCGVHGQRDYCFDCGKPVEQVPMIPLSEHEAAVGRVVELGERLHEAIDRVHDSPRKPAMDAVLSAMKAWDDLMAERFIRACHNEDVISTSEEAGHA